MPLLACASVTIVAVPSRLFGSLAALLCSRAKNWARVTPGSSRTKIGAPCGSLVTVETIRTPPDCSAPLTVIFFPFIATEIFGSEARWCAVAAWDAPPDNASERAAATAVAAAVSEKMRFKVPPEETAGTRLQMTAPGGSRRCAGAPPPGRDTPTGKWPAHPIPGLRNDRLPSRMSSRAVVVSHAADRVSVSLLTPNGRRIGLVLPPASRSRPGHGLQSTRVFRNRAARR